MPEIFVDILQGTRVLYEVIYVSLRLVDQGDSEQILQSLGIACSAMGCCEKEDSAYVLGNILIGAILIGQYKSLLGC